VMVDPSLLRRGRLVYGGEDSYTEGRLVYGGGDSTFNSKTLQMSVYVPVFGSLFVLGVPNIGGSLPFLASPLLMVHYQRWAKGPIDRSSDTDSIFRLYLTIQSVDVKFRFLYRPIVSSRFEFRFFNRPILFLGLKFRLLYLAIVSFRF
jgi:hypothetical protein